MYKGSCCDVDNMLGYTLRQGVMIVGTITIITSCLIIIAASLHKSLSLKEPNINTDPLNGINLIFALVAIFQSMYQIFLSVLLIWQSLQTPGKIFISSLWFTSHIGIATVYAVLYGVRIIICCSTNEKLLGFATVIFGGVHESVIIYFCVVVNSFIHSLDIDRYL